MVRKILTMTEIKIRESQISDYNDIRALLNDAKLFNQSITREAFKSMLKRNEGFYLVAEVEGRIVGSVFATHDGAYFGYIYKLAVDKNHRRFGVATKLVAEIIGRFKSEDLHFIFIRVNRTNKKSQEFFKSFQFRSIGGNMMDLVLR